MNSDWNEVYLKAEITNLLFSYVMNKTEEINLRSDQIAQLRDQFDTTAAANDLFDRSNMDGHLTASALILSKDERQVLLIHHKAYDSLLQPGGHFERTTDGSWESAGQAALREATEETGLKSLKLVNPFPIDIDTHPIPARPSKGEGDHRHHDVLFLTKVTEDEEINLQADEVLGHRWVDRETLPAIWGERGTRLLRRLPA